MEIAAWALLAAAIALLLILAFTSGYNDASAIVATMIASRAVGPKRAILMAATVCGAGMLFGGAAVANTITKLVVVPSDIRGIAAVASALAGAVAWNLTALRLRVPSATSHALIGGLVGATLVSFGPDQVNWGTAWLADPLGRPLSGVAGILFMLAMTPLFGFGAAFLVHKATKVALRNARFRVNQTLKRSQVATSAVLAFAHGSNAGQRAMGVFVLLLTASALTAEPGVPLWVRIVVVVTITAGIMGGGWPIMKTLGRRLFVLEPVHALDSQLSSSAVVLSATALGMPVATSHVVTTSVMGVGAAERVSSVRWQVARRILQAWGSTIPAAACFAGLIAAVLHYGAGL